MEPCGIIFIKIFSKTGVSVHHRHIFLDVNIAVFNRAPQALGKDIIKDPSSAIHADPDARICQHLGERHAGELAPSATFPRAAHAEPLAAPP